MTSWGWRPERTTGIWRHGASWIRPFVSAAPYLTILLLLALFYFVGGTLTTAKGILFDLPSGEATEGAAADLVALMMPMRHETVVFFDDSRYLLGDASSAKALGDRIAERVSRQESKTLLVMADRRISCDDLMKAAGLLRQNGVQRVLFAESEEGGEE